MWSWWNWLLEIFFKEKDHDAKWYEENKIKDKNVDNINIDNEKQRKRSESE